MCSNSEEEWPGPVRLRSRLDHGGHDGQGLWIVRLFLLDGVRLMKMTHVCSTEWKRNIGQFFVQVSTSQTFKVCGFQDVPRQMKNTTVSLSLSLSLCPCTNNTDFGRQRI